MIVDILLILIMITAFAGLVDDSKDVGAMIFFVLFFVLAGIILVH